MDCYFSLYCCDISYHIRHKLFFLTLLQGMQRCVCVCGGGGVAKCVQRHLRPPWLKMHTFIGSFFILLDARISFYLTKLCCHQSQKGEIESASRLLICFGDDDNHNLGGLMLLKRCE
jgi:hypothetical protein